METLLTYNLPAVILNSHVVLNTHTTTHTQLLPTLSSALVYCPCVFESIVKVFVDSLRSKECLLDLVSVFKDNTI